MNKFKKLLEAEKTKVIRDSKFSDVENDIITFFVENPDPDDKQVHGFADEQGVDEHKFEGMIYKILSSLIHLKGSELPDDKFDAKELKMGIAVEQEHHEHDMIAKNIAKAHLEELPDYYTRLAKMESEGEAEHE